MAPLTISKAAHDFVRENYKRPDWALGAITAHDALLLCEIIMRDRPMKCIEIGVASGVSTVFLSSCLAQVNPDAHLHSFDALPHFYAKPEIACGAFVAEVFGETPSNLTLHLGVNSVDIASTLSDDGYDFCFIDANHNNPWAALDLLSVLRLMKPGAWVALHDVNLPNLTYQGKEFPVYGPNFLFHLWRGETLVNTGERANIGAIRLRAERDSDILDAIRCFALPWTGREIGPAQFARAKAAAWLDASAMGGLFETFRRNREPVTAVAGRLAFAHANPLSRVADLPWREPLVLHPNASIERPLRLEVSDIAAQGLDFLICPAVTRSALGPPMSMALEIRDADGRIGDRCDLRLAPGDFPVPVVLRLPGEGAALSIEVSAEEGNVEDAWVRFAPMAFK